ncbi:ORF2 [Cassava satellite virus]|uniref:ORF2 n=1 Tax=Cassava satellite virus TaxID=1958957 RepID=A0A1S5XW17_9VIRU|nr:ORF2 [Cassava satellite virus]AQQ72947.1 ORF2 [Cassava satellite virus]
MKEITFFLATLDIPDEVYDFIMAHYVSWGWYAGGKCCEVTFNFKSEVRAFVNKYPDPQIASGIYTYLLKFYYLPIGVGRLNIQNFDLTRS